MLRASRAQWLTLLGLLALPPACGDSGATGPGEGETETRCYSRQEAWSMSRGGPAATSSTTGTNATSTSTTTGGAGGSGVGGSGEGGEGEGGAGDGGSGGASDGGGGQGAAGDLPPRCPTVDEIDAIWDAQTETSEPDTCCYERSKGSYEEGRPLVIDERTIVARADTTAREGAWSAAPPSIAIPARWRPALAAQWGEAALFEHASVASFAQLTLELMLRGAPSDLVRDAQQAGLDEVEHARVAFSLARAFGADPVRPGPMRELVGAAPRADAAAIVAATLRDGCIGETLAAFAAAERAARCEVPELRAVLARVADDETRHAALAWRIVAWALEERLVSEAAVRAAFGSELARLTARGEPVSPTSAADARESYGLLTEATDRALREDVAARLENLLDVVVRRAALS